MEQQQAESIFKTWQSPSSVVIYVVKYSTIQLLESEFISLISSDLLYLRVMLAWQQASLSDSPQSCSSFKLSSKKRCGKNVHVCRSFCTVTRKLRTHMIWGTDIPHLIWAHTHTHFFFLLVKQMPSVWAEDRLPFVRMSGLLKQLLLRIEQLQLQLEVF